MNSVGCYPIMNVFIEIINRKPFAPKTWHILNTHNLLPKREETALQLYRVSTIIWVMGNHSPASLQRYTCVTLPISQRQS